MSDRESLSYLLQLLSMGLLRELADLTEIEVADRRVRGNLDAALQAHYSSPSELLEDLRKATLVELCEAVELDPTGAAPALRARLENFVRAHPSIGCEAEARPAPWGPRPPAAPVLASATTAPDTEAQLGRALGRWAWLAAIVGAVLALGRARNELQYLYPERGSVIASGRRRNNLLATGLSGLGAIASIAGTALFLIFMLLAAIFGHH